MKIIFNADDFGLSKGVNLGIMESFNNGVVRSTTILPNSMQFDDALKLAKNTELKIGVHLVLTSGKSFAKHNNITDSEGKFLGLLDFEKRANLGQLDLDEVYREWDLQAKKVLDTGTKVTHFDSHHHVHMLPGVNQVFDKLVSKYGVKARAKSTQVFSSDFYASGATLSNLKEVLLKNSTAHSIELMCHPAFVDTMLMESTRYSLPRLKELNVLTDPDLKSFVAGQGWKLCSYEDVA